MKAQQNLILASIFIVIVFAILALFFFWIEESVPQNNQPPEVTDTLMNDEPESPDRELYLTIMTHMEASFIDDEDENVFLKHVDSLRYAMELADTYGVILSIESEKPFAIANTIWEIPILREIHENGHGVQTHCDFGKMYTAQEMTAEEYAEIFTENKSLVDRLVSPFNNIGCSGGGGVNDWATAASLAGFKYLNGIVAAHLLAVPYENRPDEKWTDDYINGAGWHEQLPEDINEAIYPIPLADVNDIEPDEDPVIVMMSGTVDRLDFAYDGEPEQCQKLGTCELTFEDVDAIIADIEEISEAYDPERGVAKMTVYIPVDLYIEENDRILDYFFSELDSLHDDGLFYFGTHQEIYEKYAEQKGLNL